MQSLVCNGGVGVITRDQAKPYTIRKTKKPTFILSPKSTSSTLIFNSSSHLKSTPKLLVLPSKHSLFLSTSLHLNSNPSSILPEPHCSNSSSITTTNGDGDHPRSFRNWIELVGEVLSTAFPIWVALGCLLGLLKPTSFNWVTPNLTIIGLTLTMLGMGMTLTFDDLRGALAMPKEVLIGFFLQYTIANGATIWNYDKLSLLFLMVVENLTLITGYGWRNDLNLLVELIHHVTLLQIMPLSGFFVSKLLKLPSYYAAGLILVGCCPGGTASNIVTYLARGNVALSVLMTAASTMSAVVMTPFLTAKLAGQFVAVDAAGLLMSTLQVVLLPVLGGALLNQYCKSFVEFVSPLMPPIAVLTVAVLCGNAIAQNASSILTSGKQVVLAACLLHASGFFFGYVLARILKVDVSSARTISIEVGMQNSVLGVVLATQHFGNPLTAVPCAVSSVCHSIFGSVLAGIWRSTTPTTTKIQD